MPVNKTVCLTSENAVPNDVERGVKQHYQQ